MLRSVRAGSPTARVWPFVRRAARSEHGALALLILLALVVRLYALGQLEPNLLGLEADRLALIYQLEAGNGPRLTAPGLEGAAALTLLPSLGLVALFGQSYLGLRFASVLASLLSLLAFYALARRSLSRPASLTGTALLGFSGWYLLFSRQGLLGIWVVFALLTAGLAAALVVERKQGRYWAVAGLICGLGWYGGLGGMVILPIIVLSTIVEAVLERLPRRRLVLGGSLFIATTAILIAPSWPDMLSGEGRQALTGGLDLVESARSGLPARWYSQIGLALRAFVLLDPSLPGDGRYLAAGSPVLDSLSGTLYFLGLILSFRGGRGLAFWWLTLGTYVLFVQPLGRAIPDGASGLPALTAMALLAGLSTDWLLKRKHLGSFVLPVLLIAVPAAAIWNISTYVKWQRLPSNAAARQPAIELTDFVAWRDVQREAAGEGRPTLTVNAWQQVRDQYRPPDSVADAAAAVRFASSVELSAILDYPLVPGLRKPRGVALIAGGGAYVLDADGRLIKLDPAGKQLGTFGPGSGGPSPEEASDLALEPDGSLLLLDAGRGRIDRYAPDGRFLASLGADWGMYRPRGLTVSRQGEIFIADTGHNRVVVAHGTSVDGELGEVDQPTDVAIDARGWLYVIQPDSGKLTVFDADHRARATWSGPRFNTVDGGHLTYLEVGALALTDPEKRRVAVVDLDGRSLAQAGGDNDQTFGLPYAVDSLGDRLLVADSGRPSVRAFTIAGK